MSIELFENKKQSRNNPKLDIIYKNGNLQKSGGCAFMYIKGILNISPERYDTRDVTDEMVEKYYRKVDRGILNCCGYMINFRRIVILHNGCDLIELNNGCVIYPIKLPYETRISNCFKLDGKEFLVKLDGDNVILEIDGIIFCVNHHKEVKKIEVVETNTNQILYLLYSDTDDPFIYGFNLTNKKIPCYYCTFYEL